jgi:hypothetical protein
VALVAIVPSKEDAEARNGNSPKNKNPTIPPDEGTKLSPDDVG